MGRKCSKIVYDLECKFIILSWQNAQKSLAKSILDRLKPSYDFYKLLTLACEKFLIFTFFASFVNLTIFGQSLPTSKGLWICKIASIRQNLIVLRHILPILFRHNDKCEIWKLFIFGLICCTVGISYVNYFYTFYTLKDLGSAQHLLQVILEFIWDG